MADHGAIGRIGAVSARLATRIRFAGTRAPMEVFNAVIRRQRPKRSETDAMPPSSGNPTGRDDAQVRGGRPQTACAAWRRLITGLVLVVGAGIADAKAASVALVIGNTGYQTQPPVRTASVDARATAAALERLGFAVELRIDTDTDGLSAAIAAFAEAAADAEVAVVAYFGLAQRRAGTSHLLAVDLDPSARPQWWTTTVSLRDLAAAVADARSVGLVFVDGAWPTGLGSTGRGLATLTELPDGVLVSMSTAPGELVQENVVFRSPYGVALGSALAEPDRPLSALLREIETEVGRATGGRQTPQVFGDASRLRLVLSALLAPGAADGDPETAPPQETAAPTQGPPRHGAGATTTPPPPEPPADAVAETADEIPPPAEAPAAITAPAPPPSGTDPLPLTRDEARAVQSSLSRLGFDPGVADGLIGPRSRRAIAAWQASLGAEPTGFLSAQQRAALLQAARTGG